VLATGTLVTGCGHDPEPSANLQRGEAASPVEATGGGTPRLRAMLVNGGGSPERNYQSHLLHVRELIDLLDARGTSKQDIVVFTGDGRDPAPDLAIIDPRDDGRFWMVEGLPVGEALRPEIRLEDTRLDAVHVEPATRAALESWFAVEGATLARGDTLLIYVTDHGAKNEADLSDNSIVLWGERLSVTDLGRLLAGLPRGVRTVLLMSQCYSGSFAHVIDRVRPADGIDGSVCGYFSVTAERFAYGCYPENRGRANVGHSFLFIEGLRASAHLREAHSQVLLTDRTPDIPHRTSDHYLVRLVEREARLRGTSFERLVDELLERAWADEIHYRAVFEEIDRLGQAYGSFGPRSLVELEDRSRNLRPLREDLSGYAMEWRRALRALIGENFSRFLEARPHWRDVNDPAFLDGLDPGQKRQTLDWLLEDLGDFTAADPAVRRRLDVLRTMTEEASAAAYRMEVRLGASLRMRMLLVRIAGLVLLDQAGSDGDRAAFEALESCEDFSLGQRVRPLGRERLEAAPYPPLAEEMALLATLLPGWLGLEYQPASARDRSTHGLAAGAATVTRVFGGSPAERAGLRPGDIVLGPPGAHFRESGALREFVMTAIASEVRALEVLRDGHIERFDLEIGSPP
jgi:hypothetical protein